MTTFDYSDLTLSPLNHTLLKESDPLYHPYAAFLSNIDRVYSLLKMPYRFASQIENTVNKVLAVLVCEAIKAKQMGETEGKEYVLAKMQEIGALIFLNSNGDLRDRIDNYMTTSIRGLAELAGTEVNGITIPIELTEEFAKLDDTKLIHAVNTLLDGGGGSFKGGLAKFITSCFKFILTAIKGRQGWMHNQLLSGISTAWTAFEVLAGDLWKEVLNYDPDTFVDLVAYSKSTPTEGEKKGSKQIDVSVLARHKFDLRTHMGQILSVKYDFTKLGEIKRAYKDAFQSNAISDILNDKNLLILNKTRHVIVHNAAVADDEFCKAVKGFLDAKEGEPVEYNAEQYSMLVNSSIDCGLMLIETVQKIVMAPKLPGPVTESSPAT